MVTDNTRISDAAVVAFSVFTANERASAAIQAGDFMLAAALLRDGISECEKEYEFSQGTHTHGCGGHHRQLNCRPAGASNTTMITITEVPDNDGDGDVMALVDDQTQDAVFVGPATPPHEQAADCILPQVLGTFQVYAHPLTFYTSPYQEQQQQGGHTAAINISSLPEHEYNLAYAVLLYNYGLCLHLQGLARGEEGTLEDALIAYEMALGILGLTDYHQEQANEYDDMDEDYHVNGNQNTLSSSSSSFLLELAVLNNCGQISYYFMDNRQVHECLHYMQICLYGATKAWKTKVPVELAHFAHNIIYNGAQHLRPAPAA